MDIIGQGHVEFFSPEDEGPHPTGRDSWWNESVWLQFADQATGIYGALRIGHQPNFQGGHTAIWSLIGTPEWIYKRDGLFPISGRDRLPNGFGANGTHRFEFDGRGHWMIEDEDISVHLITDDFHPPLGLTPGRALETIAKNHYEAASKISGTITLKGVDYRISAGLAYRDHSWGVRYWNHMRVHRFTAATFGPDLSCNAIAFYDETERLTKWGYVHRDGKIIIAKEVDVITFLEADGISNRGGIVRYVLPDGELLQVDLQPINKGMISRQHTLAINDTICWAKIDGRLGAAVFETNNNAQGGTLIPTQHGLVRAIIDNGISKAGPAFSESMPSQIG